MDQLVKVKTLKETVAETDAILVQYTPEIEKWAVALSSIPTIKSNEEVNLIIKEKIKPAKQIIKAIEDSLAEERKATKAYNDNRKAKGEAITAPLQKGIDTISAMIDSFAKAEANRKKEAEEKANKEREDRNKAIAAIAAYTNEIINYYAKERTEAIRKVQGFDSVETLEAYYAQLKKPVTQTLKIAKFQAYIENQREEVKAFALELVNLAELSAKTNQLAQENYDYVLSLKDSYIKSISDVEARIALQEQQARDAEAKRAEEQARIEEQKANAILAAEVETQLLSQSSGPAIKNTIKRMVLRQVAATQDIPMATFLTLVETFLMNQGNPETLLKIVIPTFERANKGVDKLELAGFIWEEDFAVRK
jgi:hypothetical protein